MDVKEKFIGPRVSRELLEKERMRFLLPTIFISLGAFLLFISIFFPYWKLVLYAPQYPDGLRVTIYVNRVEGDVREIDILNHYIGMKSLEQAAKLERSISIIAVTCITLLVFTAIYIHNQYAAFFSFPGIVYPIVFLADLYFWLRYYGTNLDPNAPLAGAVKPFIPPLIGEGKIGQFRTVATWEVGLILAFIASLSIIIGLYFHRKAYKPLVDEQNVS